MSSFFRIDCEEPADKLPSVSDIRDYVFQNYKIRITSADIVTHLDDYLVIRLSGNRSKQAKYKTS
jgi:hypothetical protein